MRRIFFCFLLAATATQVQGQLKIDNAVFFIGSGATVTVQGDISSNVSIQGTGLLQLKGSALQNVDMGGNTIPNLELDNTANATLLNTNTRIGNNLLFTNGKFQTGNLNLILGSAATVSNPNTSRFVWTNGTGQLVKELTADIAAPGFELPVGENANYRPAYLTSAGSTYDGGASVGVRVIGTADPNKPPSTAAHLNTAWPVTRTGITGGTTTLAGQYLDPTDVIGTEANIFGYYYNSTTTDWSSADETHNTGTNRISATVASNAGTVSGINKFLTVGSRAFLQGAYDPLSGLMRDDLRTLPGFGSPTIPANFPNTDPYVAAPYNTSFVHTNNTIGETIPNSGVIAAVAIPGDRIVDWVFLELRNTVLTPNNDVMQSRAALVQRDGDIVDMDGVSPVTFNNLPDANYILAVRHRNHLGLAFNETSFKLMTETRSTAFTSRVFDLRTAPGAELFGPGTNFTTAVHPGLGTVNVLWGGDASGNRVVRYTNPGNDKDAIFSSIGGSFSGSLSNQYRIEDINLNRFVRYTNPNNDKDFLVQVLGGSTSASRTQVLPN